MNRELHSWFPHLETEVNKPYFKQLMAFVEQEYQTNTIYPAKDNLFQAFAWTPLEKVKVVILGQDPYHGPNQAHGLSFSVQPGVAFPPSLRNIYTELENDLGITPPSHGHLKKWATEGVLLLNTILTVRAGEPLSHKGKGWETFTDAVIQKINERETPVAFVLWGKPAQAKKKLVAPHHLVIEAPHPSPLSAYRGFFGSKPFSKINEWLIGQGQTAVDWRIE